jgi:hypothetical protein
MTRTHVPRRSQVWLGLAVCLGVVAASCSDDEKAAPDTTTATTDSAATTTTATPKPTTTTNPPDTTTDGSEPSTTVKPNEPVMPLTGLPITDIHLAGRAALVVKIDNHPDARPQSGINEADLVYEENVENLTRFALVFQSNGADPVGPIRSGRTQDVDLLGSLHGPLFAWSGGNGRVTAAILGSDLREVCCRLGNQPSFRSKDRHSPHNLYSNVSKLFELSPPDASAPPQQFRYRADGDPVVGPEVAGLKLSMDGLKAAWEWNDDEGLFLRFQDGRPHTDTVGNAQVSTNNVVVLFVNYRPSPADKRSPEAQTLGFGEAWVYSEGHIVKGIWKRATRLDPFTLEDADGEPILLTPGRTFVELARGGKAATVDAGTSLDDVAYP